MALEDILPDRGLTDDEFSELQNQDTFDAVLRDDQPGRATWLFLQKDGEETALHYTDEEGWHVHHKDREVEDPHPPITADENNE